MVKSGLNARSTPAGLDSPLDSSVDCPLCATPSARPFHKDRMREYFRCVSCTLVFVPAIYHLSIQEQKSRYDLHRNSPEDAGYRTFLSRIIEPLIELVAPGAVGLDFGSGPGPTLSILFEERGFQVLNYDPFYAPDQMLLDSKYDFVTSTETVEHFCAPALDWELLFSLVRDGGVLGVMTTFLPIDPDAFCSWRYKDDPTHVTFYSKETFLWLAGRFGVGLQFVEESVVIFKV